MGTAEWIALISIVISFFALFYSIITNTKKFELSNDLKKEILLWNNKNIHLMNCLKSRLGVKNDLLVDLSTQIDVGRYLFPNIKRKDDYGVDKPSAFQGYRNIILDLLVAFHNLCEEYNIDKIDYSKHLEKLYKLYISFIFDTIDPRKTNKLIKKITGIKMNDGFDIHEFVKLSPDNYKIIAPYNDSNKGKTW
ncbi:MAG: hypothetical protein RBR48_04070 [Bacilli bacterium]|jgi:hypothetical protein|nr:hypothetical protein [Bacilli bacterium]MDY0209337.1 hypothetical protein [Bacilli bacterium]